MNTTPTVSSLAEARAGRLYRVTNIEGSVQREQLLRLGISEGSLVYCITVINHGPVLVRHGRTDIAIGHGLALCIRVELYGLAVQSPAKGGRINGKRFAHHWGRHRFGWQSKLR